MATLVLTIESTDAQADLQQKFQLDSNEGVRVKNALASYIKNMGNISQCNLDVQTGSADPVAASGTFTLDTVIATDVVNIGTETLTGSDTPSGENQFDTSGSDSAIATDIAAKINAHSVLSLIVSASANAAVVTVTSLNKGVIGNQIPISSPDATITASGTELSGGTGGANDSATAFLFGA